MREILIRRDNEGWRAPSAHAVSDEAELQRILVGSPSLLPGSGDVPLVAVEEFPVNTGRVDIVAVSADGSITLAECKLRSNPEIRRQVLGQVMSYASALWQMPFEEFEDAFARRAGAPLHDQSAFLDDDEWDYEDFRRATAANLLAGAFRVVVAVDDITDELKRTIAYLNTHTSNDIEILALELGYVRDGDVQILIPAVYGEETVVQKRTAQSTAWKEDHFWEHAGDVSSPESLDALRTLHRWAHEQGASFFWGEGKRHPSMTAWMIVDDIESPIWTCYLADDDATTVGLNFGWLNPRAPTEKLAALANDLRAIPEARALLTTLEESDYRKRPSMRLNGVLTRADALDAFLAAYSRYVSE